MDLFCLFFKDNYLKSKSNFCLILIKQNKLLLPIDSSSSSSLCTIIHRDTCEHRKYLPSAFYTSNFFRCSSVFFSRSKTFFFSICNSFSLFNNCWLKSCVSHWSPNTGFVVACFFHTDIDFSKWKVIMMFSILSRGS